MAAGSAQWDLVQLAVLGTRAVVVGVDPHLTSTQAGELFSMTQPVVLFVGDVAALARIGRTALQGIRHVVVLQGAPEGGAGLPEGQTLLSLESLLQTGQDEQTTEWDLADPDDAAWVIFTSGTTGRPRGLTYRHRQVCEAVGAILDTFDDIGEGARLVSWLPLSNPFQRIINLCAIARGAQTYYVPDPREVMTFLPEIRPHVFIGVPRFFEKFDAGLTASLDRKGRLRQFLFRWSLGIGSRCAARQRAGRRVPLYLRPGRLVADVLVFRRIRGAFGGELRYAVSGSAAMPVWLLERMHAMGLLVLEAYGLSECIVPVASNRPGAFRFGSVGRVLRGNRIRLAEDGELLLKSDGLLEGYIGASAEPLPIDSDGWLATSDLAEVDADGFIRLIGRKSEIFKTSTGRRVAPNAIEAALRSAPGVSDAAVFGAGRQSLLAVVALSAENRLSAEPMLELIERALEQVPEYQRPAGFVLTRSPFTVDAGELTSNLKLRRHAVLQRYDVALRELEASVDTGRRHWTRSLEPGAVELLIP